MSKADLKGKLCQYECSDSGSESEGSVEETQTKNVQKEDDADEQLEKSQDDSELPKAYTRHDQNVSDPDVMTKRSERNSSPTGSPDEKREKKSERHRHHRHFNRNLHEEELCARRSRRDGSPTSSRSGDRHRSPRSYRHRDYKDRKERRSDWRGGEKNDAPWDADRLYSKKRRDEEKAGSSGFRRESRYKDMKRDATGTESRHYSRNNRNQESSSAQGHAGTSVTSYFKPGTKAIGKLTEQLQKRKQLWQGAKEKTVGQSWETMLAACTDEKQAEKLKKMIGMRDENPAPSTSSQMQGPGAETAMVPRDEAKRQQEIAKNLQQQYDLSRMLTHTHRGMGLGFRSQF